MRDRSGSEAVTSKASLESDDKMRGEAQRLRTIFLQLSTTGGNDQCLIERTLKEQILCLLEQREQAKNI